MMDILSKTIYVKELSIIYIVFHRFIKILENNVNYVRLNIAHIALNFLKMIYQKVHYTKTLKYLR